MKIAKTIDALELVRNALDARIATQPTSEKNSDNTLQNLQDLLKNDVEQIPFYLFRHALQVLAPIKFPDGAYFEKKVCIKDPFNNNDVVTHTACWMYHSELDENHNGFRGWEFDYEPLRGRKMWLSHDPICVRGDLSAKEALAWFYDNGMRLRHFNFISCDSTADSIWTSPGSPSEDAALYIIFSGLAENGAGKAFQFGNISHYIRGGTRVEETEYEILGSDAYPDRFTYINQLQKDPDYDTLYQRAIMLVMFSENEEAK